MLMTQNNGDIRVYLDDEEEHAKKIVEYLARNEMTFAKAESVLNAARDMILNLRAQSKVQIV